MKRETEMSERRKLLVVDDDPGMRSQLKWGCEGFDVVTAEDRIHALDQFGKYHPGVVTLDLGMPPDADGCKEGFATLKQILELAPQTKVIIVSASEGQANKERAIESGAYEYFPKPVDIDKLSLTLEKAYLEYEGKS